MSAAESWPSSIRSFSVSSFNRQFRFRPSFPAARHVPEIVEAFFFQNACCDTRTITTGAVNRGWLRAIEFTHPLSQLRQKNVTRSGNVPVRPFPRRTNIDNLQLSLAFVQLMHAHLPDLCLFESCGLPRFHPTDQIPGEL